jgi:hypothetical protein
LGWSCNGVRPSPQAYPNWAPAFAGVEVGCGFPLSYTPASSHDESMAYRIANHPVMPGPSRHPPRRTSSRFGFAAPWTPDQVRGDEAGSAHPQKARDRLNILNIRALRHRARHPL